MGKKGKVELKRKREAYFAEKRRQRKRERKQKLKRRKPLSQDLQNIKDGITEMIRDQGAEPSSVAYFACLLSLLQSKPDPKRLPYIIALTDYFMGDVSQGVLHKHHLQLMDSVIDLAKQHLADNLIVKKSFTLLKSVFYHLPPSAAMFKRLQKLEPNKLQSDHMTIYLKTFTTAFLLAHEKSPELTQSMYLAFVQHNTGNLFDTAEPVANAAARAFSVIFENTLDTAMIKKHSSEVVAMLNHFTSCICDIQYRNNWDHMAEAIAVILSKIALTKSVLPIRELFGDVIKTRVLPIVDKLRSLDDFHYNNACEKALGAALRCIGSEELLQVLPLNPLDLDPVSGRHHLLTVFRRNVSHDKLSFFVQFFAPLITRCRKAEQDALLQGKHLERKTLSAIHYQLWDLLPGYSTFPQDLTEGSTYKTIAKELTKMFNDVELSRVACRVFVILIEKAKYLVDYVPEEDEMDQDMEDASGDEESLESSDDESNEEKDTKLDKQADVPKQKEANDDDSDEKSLDPVGQAEAELEEILGTDFTSVPPETDPYTFHMISKEKAESYLALIGTFSKNVIPLICNAIEKEKDENRRALLLQSLRSYASVADKSVLNGVFKQVSRTLITNTKKEGQSLTDDQRCNNRLMMEIGCVIVEYLDKDALMILLSIIEPLLADESEDYLLQKKTYRVLSRICRTRAEVVLENIDRIVHLLAQSQMTCDSASKKERILCFLYTATMYSDHSQHSQLKEFVTGTVAEVMLALKEPSTRTRDTAFTCLGVYATLTDVNSFTQMIFAGLAGTTPQLVSCTIITLSKILDEYHDSVETKLKAAVIKSCIMFIRHKSNEIKNASMSFARLILKIVSKSPAVRDILQDHLPELVQGCLSWTSQKKTPGNTRRNVQLILERCIKRYGYDHMMSIFPEEHKRYLEYTERMRQREIKKDMKHKQRKMREGEERRQKFNELFFGDAKGQKETLPMGVDTDNFDLLDEGIVKRFVTSKENTVLDRIRDDRGKDDGMNVGLKGDKITIQSEADYKRDLRHEILQRKLAQMEGTQRSGLEELSSGVLSLKRKRRRDDDDDDLDVNAAYDETALQAKRELEDLQRALKGPSKKDRPRESKRARIDTDVRTGSQFRAKPGSFGDVKKGGTDPYAYVPLNAKFLNKRHRKKSISRMASVSETAPKGKPARRAQ